MSKEGKRKDPYYAHSTCDASRRDWEPLPEHLQRVSARTEEFAQPFEARRAARLVGLLHDLGKYSADFQARLDGARISVDHSTAGAKIVTELAGNPDDEIIAELLAYAIAGHHAGLPNKQGDGFSTLSERLRRFTEATLDPVWREEIDPVATNLAPPFLKTLQDERRIGFSLAFLGRMIFSCLVDADFKETERFYAETEGREVDREWPHLQTILPELTEAFERHMAGFRQSDTDPEKPIQSLRRDILQHVRSHAPDQPGCFTLTVPTGGGKTLASLGFALDHAKSHSGFRRIIYAAPFTAIIDQTAQVFRKALGETPGNEIILEHHSSIEDKERKFDKSKEVSENDSRKADRDKLKLAMEDWAAPIIVTTNVQLFESLFAAKTSRCRKLHNIAGSIIILDEAQTLPPGLLAPATWALQELAEHYGCTVILCTATQPALDRQHFVDNEYFQKRPMGLPLAGRELAPDPAELTRRLARVRIRRGGAMNDKALVSALGEEDRGLVIVNSRKHALALFNAANTAGLAGVIHLSTRQYAEHRRRILTDIRHRLKNELPCRVIATSLVEAGVDLDFPKVWRAEAGLDQIVQAAGRCNREGGNPVDESIVTVFSSPDFTPPPEVKKLAAVMNRVAEKYQGDLLSLEAIEAFFRESYWTKGEGLDEKGIWDLFKLTQTGTSFSYRTAAERFRMIENDMVPIIVEGDERAHKAIDMLEIETISSGAIARLLQPYIVQTPPKARQILMDAGHVIFAAERKRGDQFAVLRYEKLYDPAVGLLWENPDYMAAEDTLI